MTSIAGYALIIFLATPNGSMPMKMATYQSYSECQIAATQVKLEGKVHSVQCFVDRAPQNSANVQTVYK